MNTQHHKHDELTGSEKASGLGLAILVLLGLWLGVSLLVSMNGEPTVTRAEQADDMDFRRMTAKGADGNCWYAYASDVNGTIFDVNMRDLSIPDAITRGEQDITDLPDDCSDMSKILRDWEDKKDRLTNNLPMSRASCVRGKVETALHELGVSDSSGAMQEGDFSHPMPSLVPYEYILAEYESVNYGMDETQARYRAWPKLRTDVLKRAGDLSECDQYMSLTEREPTNTST